MPKVLRIINRLNLGGITYNVTYLTRFMAPEYETMLVSGMKDDEEESSEFILDQYGVKAHYVKEMKREINFASDRKAYLEIKDLIKKFKPDIVHTHAAKAGALGRLAAIACNVPVIVHTFHGHTFHSYFSPLKTRFFIEIERYLARKSTAIITISQLQKEEICNRFKICPPEKAHIIPLGFDLSRFKENMDEKRKQFRQEFNIAEDCLAVGIIGRFAMIKNHSFFLEAFKALTERTNKRVIAVLVGDGEERENILQVCKRLSLPVATHGASPETKVVFTSWIKDVDRALAGLDVVCLTSHNEGTPVSLIEAQAASKPVVSTRVGGIENVVKVNETGLLSDAGDLQQFVHNLLRVIENEQLRNNLVSNSWTFVKDKFHYTRLVKDTKFLYNELLSNRK
ncbi:MAG: glycosyltransferase [Bacteroidetes bacterium]|jgi:glycosyltransferase involved in cell wall biosynthesis|nr:glycosyltransferase [Bacteroidota bacterium]